MMQRRRRSSTYWLRRRVPMVINIIYIIYPITKVALMTNNRDQTTCPDLHLLLSKQQDIMQLLLAKVFLTSILGPPSVPIIIYKLENKLLSLTSRWQKNYNINKKRGLISCIWCVEIKLRLLIGKWHTTFPSTNAVLFFFF